MSKYNYGFLGSIFGLMIGGLIGREHGDIGVLASVALCVFAFVVFSLNAHYDE